MSVVVGEASVAVVTLLVVGVGEKISVAETPVAVVALPAVVISVFVIPVLANDFLVVGV